MSSEVIEREASATPPEKTGGETAVETGTGQQPTVVGSGEKTGFVKCPACGEVATEQGRATHFRNNHPDLSYDEYKDKFEIAPPPSGETGMKKKEGEEIAGGKELTAEEESEGLAKSATDKLLYELEKNMETFNVPGTGKAGAEKRKRILAVLGKAPSYRDWHHVHSLLSTAGADPVDAKAICDMTFSQVSQEDLKREAGQAQEVAAGGKEPPKEESLDDHLKKTMDRLTMGKLIKNLGSDDVSEIAKGAKDEDIDRLLTLMMNRQMKMQMIKSLQSGETIGSDSKKNSSRDEIIRIIEEHERAKEEKLTRGDIIKIFEESGRKKEGSLTKEDIAKIMEGQGKKSGGEISEERLLQLIDDRERKKREETEKTALMQTLDGVRQALDNLHGRVSTIEQGGVPRKHSEDDTWNKKILNAAGNKLINLLEKGEATEEKLRAFAKELKPSLPPGARTEYDMRVEQAQHEADARKTEALEHRRGFEALASGIRDGLAGIGWNIGAGAAGGPVRSMPSSETQPEMRMSASEPQLPIRGADGQRYVNCPRCHNPLMIPEGQARVMCSLCGEIINIMTREEELKQKVSAEKSKAPETKAEVKKVKLEREEKKPLEVEKPESIEKKPSAEAKPKEKPPETEKLETVEKLTEEKPEVTKTEAQGEKPLKGVEAPPKEKKPEMKSKVDSNV